MNAIKEYWVVIEQNPVAFIAFVALGLSLGYFFGRHQFSAKVSVLETRIDMKDD